MEEDKMKKQSALVNKENKRLQKMTYGVEDSENDNEDDEITNTIYNMKV